MDDPTIALADRRPRALEQVAPGLHGVQVSAGGEGAPGPGQDHAADVEVSVDRLAHRRDLVAVRQVGQGVEPLGPVQCQHQHAAPAVL